MCKGGESRGWLGVVDVNDGVDDDCCDDDDENDNGCCTVVVVVD